MSFTDMPHTRPRPDWGLPDPDSQSAFYADVPMKRLLAWMIDVLVIGLLTLLTLPLTLFVGLFFLPPLFFVIGYAYRVVTLTNRSATLGMRVMSIEFRTVRGALFDLPAALLHTTGYAVSISVFPLQIVSVVLMATSARGQGLTDLILGTAAINRAAAS